MAANTQVMEVMVGMEAMVVVMVASVEAIVMVVEAVVGLVVVIAMVVVVKEALVVATALVEKVVVDLVEASIMVEVDMEDLGEAIAMVEAIVDMVVEATLEVVMVTVDDLTYLDIKKTILYSRHENWRNKIERQKALFFNRVNFQHYFLFFKHQFLHVHEQCLQIRQLHGRGGVGDALLDLVRHHRLLLPQLDVALSQWYHLTNLGMDQLPPLDKTIVHLVSIVM